MGGANSSPKAPTAARVKRGMWIILVSRLHARSASMGNFRWPIHFRVFKLSSFQVLATGGVLLQPTGYEGAPKVSVLTFENEQVFSPV
jgi:hypothetical protein